jgi:hypothetical protein
MKVAGVSYDINWRTFNKGKSLFFPCLDAKEAWREARPVFRRLGFTVAHKSVVDPESGIRGLRIWRI